MKSELLIGQELSVVDIKILCCNESFKDMKSLLESKKVRGDLSLVLDIRED